MCLLIELNNTHEVYLAQIITESDPASGSTCVRDIQGTEEHIKEHQEVQPNQTVR